MSGRTVARRRSPLWVRQLTSQKVHGIATKLQHEQRQHDLSERQEWLWDCLISELEYRARREPRWWLRCSCELCAPPFPD